MNKIEKYDIKLNTLIANANKDSNTKRSAQRVKRIFKKITQDANNRWFGIDTSFLKNF